jgi:hypothetical protein
MPQRGQTRDGLSATSAISPPHRLQKSEGSSIAGVPHFWHNRTMKINKKIQQEFV